MWSDDFQLGMYIEYGLQHNDKDPIFKVADHLRISKYKKICERLYCNYKNTVQWINVISDLNGKQIFETFCGKAFGKTNQQEFMIEKAIYGKDDKLCVK